MLQNFSTQRILLTSEVSGISATPYPTTPSSKNPATRQTPAPKPAATTTRRAVSTLQVSSAGAEKPRCHTFHTCHNPKPAVKPFLKRSKPATKPPKPATKPAPPGTISAGFSQRMPRNPRVPPAAAYTKLGNGRHGGAVWRRHLLASHRHRRLRASCCVPPIPSGLHAPFYSTLPSLPLQCTSPAALRQWPHMIYLIRLP
ncbi:hypothetical protein C8J57DRAFT_1633788 [Mycena rebaudengoi]|nr:hypothetical protein C8J57DRAFT_1633788 [Mycena rebaudengoi]